ncbi:hypothetical protein GOBAR_AA09769 [Gossypium barbadense]|uniref:Endonuclease/exonuclease/phosphatase domain-containing protein n=1 Tax=Gossypium barbadense TaxID=3634 RepID=A0A2P5Y5K3_GOSBA|nr:hypothetical protein GOBAR_AA09769 [Gossypium barbadense]
MSTNDFRRLKNKCRLQNRLAVNSEGRSGGLPLMWRDVMNVSIQNYSKYHIDSMVKLENNKNIQVTGFYGVRDSVREEWVVGGDFNEILNDAENEGRCRGVRAHMNEFKEVMDDLALVDIKPYTGWFTWGQKLKDYPKDNKLCFKFDVCWASDEEAKNVIERAWNRYVTDYGDKIERVTLALGPWQCKKYGKMKSDMRKLENHINLVIYFASREESVKTLKETRKRLDFLYAREAS